MDPNLLVFLDWFFLIFHGSFTLFNLVGWIWKKTRKIHLITILLTLFSWVVLGIWYGFGYCFCTDWHWDVIRMLGRDPGTNSYIHYMVRELTGWDPGLALVVDVARIAFILLLVGTISLNLKDFIIWRRKKQQKAESQD
jgi:hypothetical protein